MEFIKCIINVADITYISMNPNMNLLILGLLLTVLKICS